MKTITEAGIVATTMIAVSIAAAWGVMSDILGADTPVRIMMIFPKAVLRTPVARASRRFAGWVFVLGGLVSAALWAFAPLAIATPAAMTVTAGSAILAIGFCFLTRRGIAAAD
jgi:hypothetical protein